MNAFRAALSQLFLQAWWPQAKVTTAELCQLAQGTGSQGTEGCRVAQTTQEPSLSLDTQPFNAAQSPEEVEDKAVQQEALALHLSF